MLPLQIIHEQCAEFGLRLSDRQGEQLAQYAQLLVEWNEKMNLTAITDPQDMAIKHFLDCLYLLKYCDIPQGARLIDVGTGAGFPGMVLKIARPDLDLTLLDSLNKRLVFLNEVASALNLQVTTIHVRAEAAGKDVLLRESYDVATARAVARLSALSEYCLPLVKIGGQMIAMKGPDGNAELEQAATALATLGGEVGTVHEYSLPNGDARSIVQIKKISQTPSKYPRQGVKIAKKPLE